MNKTLEALARAYQEVMAEKKMDPVGQADADIDNDGDVDSSDEYLHKRRKAIKKSMKKGKDDPKGESGETATMNPKAEEQKEEFDKNAAYRELNSLSQKLKSNPNMTQDQKDTIYRRMNSIKSKMKYHGVKEGTIREKLLSVLEDRAMHYRGATEPEPIDSKDSPGGKQMRADLGDMEVTVDGNKAAADTAQSIATSVKAAPGRTNDNKAGDNNIVNPVDDVTKKAGFKEVVKGITDAYKAMKK